MIKINKGPVPQEWIDYCRTPGVEYQAIPELVEALYREQGYICAYCMRRIPVRDSNYREDHRIDHIQCRDDHPNRQLNYSNMVICCPGAINGGFIDRCHCDRKKGDNDVSFNLFSDHFIGTISYSTGTGEIKCSVSQWNDEINRLLNLNNGLLKANRKAVIESIIKILGKPEWKTRNIMEQLNSWKGVDREGKRKEFCGVAVWFLNRVLSRP